MATQLNQLGAHLFRQFLTPPPGRIQEEVETILLPGVDYALLRRNGLHPRPFQMETVVDCLSGNFAEIEYTLYASTVGESAAKLVWNGFDYDSLNLRFAVTEVELLSIRRMIYICGSLRGGVWDLRARWTGVLTPTE